MPPDNSLINSELSNIPNHILIEGDNLVSLTTLAYTHAGKIDVIYIDPPYNTGNKDFAYNDDYVDRDDAYRHSKWLSFMAKRLKIAKKLLSKDGIIFISIDDNEVAPLKLLCDEIFKPHNILAVLIWDLGTGTQAGHFTRAHEYVLVYASDKSITPNFSGGDGEIDHSALKKISRKNPPIEYTFKAGTIFNAPDGTELTDSWGTSERTELVRGRMVAENGKLKYDVTLRAGFAMISQMKSWFAGKHTLDSKGQEVTSFYFNSSGVLHYKKNRSIINPPTILKSVASTKAGTIELAESLGKTEAFGYPKPLSLISFLTKLKATPKYILDFFAGSGTTLHAVMQLNAEDGGKRQCILCTNNENGICENVTYERNKRVIQGYTKPNGEKVEGLHGNNLRYYRTEFISRSRSPRNMQKLVNLSTDMLCIKENLYTEQDTFGSVKTHPQVFRCFTDGERQMLIIYREEYIEEIVGIIATVEVKSPIKVYVFSPSEDPATDLFEPVADKVEPTALPAAIYNTYKRILPRQRDKVIAVPENSGEAGESTGLGGLFNTEGGEA